MSIVLGRSLWLNTTTSRPVSTRISRTLSPLNWSAGSTLAMRHHCTPPQPRGSGELCCIPRQPSSSGSAFRQSAYSFACRVAVRMPAVLCASWSVKPNVLAGGSLILHKQPVLLLHTHAPAASLKYSQIHRGSHMLQLQLVRQYAQKSRMIRYVERKRRSQMKVKTLQLIDENGTNLGTMASGMAVQLADAKGLKLVQVRKEAPDSSAVFKLFTTKELWEEQKREKQQNKPDPRNTTKEITISTHIAEHDLEVKLGQTRDFLEKTHNVRMYIESKVRRLNEHQLSIVQKQQAKMLQEIEKKLEDVGMKAGKESVRRNKLVCTFKSLVGL